MAGTYISSGVVAIKEHYGKPDYKNRKSHCLIYRMKEEKSRLSQTAAMTHSWKAEILLIVQTLIDLKNQRTNKLNLKKELEEMKKKAKTY